jgi:hypothetical protein
MIYMPKFGKMAQFYEFIRRNKAEKHFFMAQPLHKIQLFVKYNPLRDFLQAPIFPPPAGNWHTG